MEPKTVQIDWNIVMENLPSIGQAFLIDLYIALMGFLLACVVGLAVASLRGSESKLLKISSYIYTQIVRGVPLYVLILWIYFGLATAAGIVMTPVAATILAIGVIASGTTAEIFRSSFDVIDRGQVEAALSTGMRRLQIYRHVLLPQAMRVAIPPLGNVVIFQLKAATYGAAIAVPGMVFIAQDISMTQFRPFEAYATVAAILVAVVFMLSLIVVALERALRLP